MKRRTVTYMQWPERPKGLSTTIPLTNPDSVVEIRSITIQQIWTKGQRVPSFACIYLELSHLDARAREYVARLRDSILAEGVTVQTPNPSNMLYFTFEPKEKGEGFCTEAIKKLLVVLEKIGAKKEELSVPRITQQTLLWVSYPYKDGSTQKCWIEYGHWLFIQLGLKQPM